jgi:type VI secretion system secreted protein Hcp
MAVNAFISFFDKALGESVQKGKKNWVEIRAWDWEVDAETSWTKGGGASVGKPHPGSMNFEHYFSGDEEGNVVQRVEMVFKTVKIEYKPHQSPSGQLGAGKIYTWDIPAGTASPSA